MLSCNGSPQKNSNSWLPDHRRQRRCAMHGLLGKLHEAAVVSLQQQSEPEKMGISWGDSVEMPQMSGKKRGTWDIMG